ncbi:MAG TPA: anti-sigma factor [Thermoanaerobaculia bacterium]|nr:anti-sigma factor [Thermoanaerobaculia bacterium]
MTSDHSPRHDDLLPAYALGALDGEERRELQAHVEAGCPVCAAELRRLAACLEDLAGAAAVLPEDLAGPAPGTPEVPEMLAGIRQRLLAQVAAEPRAAELRAAELRASPPPATAAAPAPATPAAPAAAAPARFGRRRAPGDPTAPTAPAAPAAPATPAGAAGRWPLLAAAAMLALVAVWGIVRQASLGAEIEHLQGERRQLVARADALERRVTQMQAESERLARTLTILAAPKVQSVSLAGMGTTHSAVGRTYIDAARRQAVFYASNLPALGPDKSYQLWYLDEDDQKTSAGVFDVDASGKAALVIDQPLPLERIQGWVVTVEPRGGRPQPTGPIAMAG